MHDDLFKTAMQRLAGAVSVITTVDDEGRYVGITATAVCSLTVDPPALLVCVNRQTWLGGVLPRSRRFAVNVLGLNHQPVAEVFAGMRPGVVGPDRFAHGSWTPGLTGSPMLDGALASFDCVMDDLTERSTHLVAFGIVQHAVLTPDVTDEPLVYHLRRFTSVA